MSGHPETTGDEVLAALDTLVEALRENIRVNQEVVRRARLITQQRQKGRSHREIMETAERPLIVEMLTANLSRLQEAGSALRRAQARALRAEGATMEDVARLFGVTRQRVSALLGAHGVPRRRPAGSARAAVGSEEAQELPGDGPEPAADR